MWQEKSSQKCSTVVDCCMQAADAVKGLRRLHAMFLTQYKSLRRVACPSLWCYAVNQSDTNYVCHMTTRDCKWKTLRGAHPSALSNGAHGRRRMNEVSIDTLTHSFTIPFHRSWLDLCMFSMFNSETQVTCIHDCANSCAFIVIMALPKITHHYHQI